MLIYLKNRYLSIVVDDIVKDKRPEDFADYVVIRDVCLDKTIRLNSDDIGRIESQNKDPEWQKRMAKHSDLCIVRCLSENPNLVPGVQNILAKHSEDLTAYENPPKSK